MEELCMQMQEAIQACEDKQRQVEQENRQLQEQIETGRNNDISQNLDQINEINNNDQLFD